MIVDPRDKTGYWVAVASLGVAVAVLLAGICLIAAQGNDTTTTVHRRCVPAEKKHCRPEVWSHSDSESSSIPDGLWAALGALGGVLIGVLIPLPLLESSSGSRRPNAARLGWLPAGVAFAAAVAVIVARDHGDSITLYALAASLAGLLLGLFIPSPGQDD